jgi:putative hydrolase of the HAD superfamily
MMVGTIMIDKVLFDLGNVLLRFDFGRAYQGMALHGARIDALTTPEMRELVAAYETGRIDDDTLFQRASALVGYEGSQDHFERSWQDIFEVNEPMRSFLRDLRGRGIPCYLLSNSNALHVSHIEATYDVLAPFNDIIFSHEAKAMKPDEEIYHKAIAQFGLDPAKTAYIDDLPENIETGRRLGFHCVHYDPEAHELAENELRALGLMTP